jgi:hypothetical protein
MSDRKIEGSNDTVKPTGEVGGEGGGGGNLEIGHDAEPTSGSEATETLRRREDENVDEVRRNDAK